MRTQLRSAGANVLEQSRTQLLAERAQRHLRYTLAASQVREFAMLIKDEASYKQDTNDATSKTCSLSRLEKRGYLPLRCRLAQYRRKVWDD